MSILSRISAFSMDFFFVVKQRNLLQANVSSPFFLIIYE